MAVGGFTTTNSSQQLMNADAESVTASGSVMSIDGDIGDDKRPSSRNSHQYEGLSSVTYSEWFAVGVLCFVNLINYMDRFTIAGKFYSIGFKLNKNVIAITSSGLIYAIDERYLMFMNRPHLHALK